MTDGFIAIEQAVVTRERAEPGVAAAVRAAGHAVLAQRLLAPDDFAESYRYVETVIPFASLSVA